MKAKQFTVVVFVALIGGLIGGILSSQMFNGRLAFAKDDKPLKVVRAEKFELVDKKGKVRAELYHVAGVTNLQVGPDDEAHININQFPFMAGISLQGSTGYKINLLSAEGGAWIQIFDKKDKRGLQAAVDILGDPSIRLQDKNGNDRLVIGTTELENLTTGSKEFRSEGSIVIFDKDGKVIRQMP